MVQVERDGFPIPSPGADFVLLPRDRLHFSGVIDSILSLTQLDGLTLSEEEVSIRDLRSKADSSAKNVNDNHCDLILTQKEQRMSDYASDFATWSAFTSKKVLLSNALG